MNRGIVHQLSLLEQSFQDLRRLKEFACKIKRPPRQGLGDGEELPKEKRPQMETAKNSCISLQAKYKSLNRSSQTSDSEIINFLEQQSSMSFSTAGIVAIAEHFHSTEDHIRHLLSKIVSFKHRR